MIVNIVNIREVRSVSISEYQTVQNSKVSYKTALNNIFKDILPQNTINFFTLLSTIVYNKCIVCIHIHKRKIYTIFM